MTGFGEKLRREREMRGVSLEEISESTKIGTRSLRALEEDDFDKLPGGIFNKGFVRAYSRFLGLDEEQTVADFEAALKAYRLANNYVEELPVQEEPEPQSSRSGWLVLSISALVVVAAVTGYFLRGRPTQVPEAQSTVQATPVSSESHQSSASPAAPPTLAITPSIAAAAPSRAETPPTSTIPLKSTTPTTENSPSSANGDTNSADAPATKSNSPIRLNVFAREESWLSISADGRDLGQQILAAQKSRTILAQKEVRLKVGNLGGVEVSFNGKPVNIDGEPKQVKELTFTPEGLHQ